MTETAKVGRDPFDLFVRSCRRALRDVIRERGEVPPKVDMVSRGPNPRRLEVSAVTLREVAAAVRIRGMVLEWRSEFVGLARLFPDNVEIPDAVPCPSCDGETGDGVDDATGCPCATCECRGTLDRLVGLTAFSVDRTATFAVRVNPLDGVGSWREAGFGPGDIEGLRAALMEVWAK